ncbi:hypothetical protein [Nocardia salmonicida]|uniref:hypothetical protein n=1 Tax=Nocardia salmonicida TaxID=53431 RepID=UPI0037923216
MSSSSTQSSAAELDAMVTEIAEDASSLLDRDPGGLPASPADRNWTTCERR